MVGYTSQCPRRAICVDPGPSSSPATDEAVVLAWRGSSSDAQGSRDATMRSCGVYCSKRAAPAAGIRTDHL